MKYQSTRNAALTAASTAAVLEGMAPDGGLYVAVPPSDFDWRGLLGLDYRAMAARVLAALLPDFPEMERLVAQAYAGKFETDELTPLVPVGERYVLELFRGPTSAFKDVALSMLPLLMTAARTQEGTGGETLILTATSGDTGKAALEGFRDVPGTRILVFYPDGGVSPVQRAQMATQEGGNVCVCAVRGNFDEIQNGVKAIFQAGLPEDSGLRLSSANSINIGRLAPQVVYYFKAYSDLVRRSAIAVGQPVDFVVPTGNFGDILAGYLAGRLGLPVGKLVCASNRNDVLTQFLATGVYDRRRPFYKTISPSMDILVSSNLERLLWYLSGSETEVAALMRRLAEDGVYRVSPALLERLHALFAWGRCSDGEAQETIARVWRERGYLLDPHTAVAWKVAEDYARESGSAAPAVVLSTASAYKFPGAVLESLTGERGGDEFAQMERLHRRTGVPIPAQLAALARKPVRHTDGISPEEMRSYVLRKAREKQWNG